VRKSRTPGSVRGYPVTGIPTATRSLRMAMHSLLSLFAAHLALRQGEAQLRQCP
jgi:hypothetical protein